MRRRQHAVARLTVGRDKSEMVGKAHASAYGVTTASCSTLLQRIFGPKSVDAQQNLPHKPGP
jgi:hypothetical protein